SLISHRNFSPRRPTGCTPVLPPALAPLSGTKGARDRRESTQDVHRHHLHHRTRLHGLPHDQTRHGQGRHHLHRRRPTPRPSRTGLRHRRAGPQHRTRGDRRGRHRPAPLVGIPPRRDQEPHPLTLAHHNIVV